MANSPHMPANMPIAQQRIVRGDAVRRLPGSVSSEYPRFSYPGVVDALDTSPGWVVSVPATYVQAVVCMVLDPSDDVVFDILVHDPYGTLIATETVTAATIDAEAMTYSINVPVVVNDVIRLELTDFGTGLNEDLSVVLRTFSQVIPI